MKRPMGKANKDGTSELMQMAKYLAHFKSFLLVSWDLKVNLFGLQQDICDGVK